MGNPASPLTDAHLQQINSALNTIQTTENQITLAKQAGIDVTNAEQQLASNKQKLLMIKRTYFPNG